MAPPSAIEVNGTTDTAFSQLSNPLSSKAIATRRAKAGKLVAGTASFTSSAFFKDPVSYDSSQLRPVLTLVGRRQAKGEEMGPYVATSPIAT